MADVVVEREIECKADVVGLWPLITDTNALNKAVGMDRIELTALSDATAARYLVTTRMGGGTVEFEERPYEWVYPERFKVFRKMRSGALTTLEMAFWLAPREGGGSRVTLRLTVGPRVSATAPF